MLRRRTTKPSRWVAVRIPSFHPPFINIFIHPVVQQHVLAPTLARLIMLKISEI